MATGNGHDPNTTRMVELLEKIGVELGGLREESRATNARLAELRQDVTAGFAETHKRLTKLEAVVFRRTGTG